VAGVIDTTRQNVISKLGMVRGIEIHFSSDNNSIVRLAKETLPSIVIVDLASSEYNAFDCCHELEWHPDITVYCLYPDDRKDLLNEAYGWGFDTSSEYSHLEEHLSKYLQADYDSQDMPYKLRKWLEK
jgi:DNA-binding NarL/FixJ family response regulator